MSRGIARKGDTDHLGYVILGDVSTNVRINGLPVALKDSLMHDGVTISSDVSTGLRVNNRAVALQGSTTERHERFNPKGPGIINQASVNTRTS